MPPLKKIKPLKIVGGMFLILSLAFFSLISWQNVKAILTQVIIDNSVNTTATTHNGSSPTSVFISDTTGYVFYVDGDGTCVYKKTTDKGATWSAAVVVDSQTDCIRVAVWYDQWTPGLTGDRIHIATIDSGSSAIWYTRLNTLTDALSATVNVSANSGQGGAFAAGTTIHSITKGTNGNLYVGVENSADSYVLYCTGTCANAANWLETGSNPFPLANHWVTLMPLASGKILAISWRISADIISSKVYNDNTDSWSGAWTNIDTDAVDNTTYDAAFGATLNPATNDIYLVYTSHNDTLGTDDDIRTAVYSGGTWTATADILTDDARGVTGAKIGYDSQNNRVNVYYTVQETAGLPATANIYYKSSFDNMVTWGAQSGPINSSDGNIYGARVNLISDKILYASWVKAGTDNLLGTDTVTVAAISRGHHYVYPENSSVVINNGAAVTESEEVTLTLTSTNANGVVICNNNQFVNCDWQAFTSPSDIKWSLLPGDGNKVIYVIFRSIDNNLSNTLNPTIELKTPVVTVPETVVPLEQSKPDVQTEEPATGTEPLVTTEPETNIEPETTITPTEVILPPAEICQTEMTFTQYLFFGTAGSQVVALQDLLKCLGYFPKTLKSTGWYGLVTIAAVRELQRSNNIIPVGMVGPLTRALLNSKY